MANRTPEDVWRRVFLSLYYDEPSDFDGDPMPETEDIDAPLAPRTPLDRERLVSTLSGVCSQWRTIIRDISIMWTEMSCTLGSQGHELLCLDHLERSLSLSKQQEITVLLTRIHIPGESSHISLSRPMETVMLHRHRIKYFIVFVDPRVHSLKRIPLDPVEYVNCHDDGVEIKVRVLWRKHPFRFLATEQPFTGLPLTRLTRLALHDAEFTCLSFLFSFLQNSPQLSHLALMGSTDFLICDEVRGMTFDLPSLETMAIDVAYLTILSRVGLRTPKLRHLGVCHWSYMPQNADEIVWGDYAKSIRHLMLVGDWDYDAIVRALEGRRDLQQLSLIYCHFGGGLTSFLCAPSSRFLEDNLEVQNLKKLNVVNADYLTDADVQLLIDERNSSKYPGVPTMEFKLIGCRSLTEKTVKALTESGRGTCELQALDG